MSSPVVSRLVRSRTFAFATGFAASVLAVLPFSSARAEDLVVKYDQSQLLRLPRPVAEIIVGNPSIADVTVNSGNLLVVTGKTFGVTNVIALDSERNVIQDQRVVVTREDARIVSLHRGVKRETYNCAPLCNPSLMIGDDTKYFEEVGKASQSKTKFSEGSGDSGGGGGGNQ